MFESTMDGSAAKAGAHTLDATTGQDFALAIGGWMEYLQRDSLFWHYVQDTEHVRRTSDGGHQERIKMQDHMTACSIIRSKYG